MKKLVIGIGNKARQGKDTVAKLLNEKICNSVVLHFADALYTEVRNVNTDCPLIVNHGGTYFIYDCNTNKYIITDCSKEPQFFNTWIREKTGEYGVYNGMIEKDGILLQWWGTDFRRKQDDKYWINQMDKLIEHCSYNVIFIPDTRFYNEHEFVVEDWNGIYVQVKRYDNNERFITTDRDAKHESETQLDFADAFFTIINDDINLLNYKVEELVDKLQDKFEIKLKK